MKPLMPQLENVVIARKQLHCRIVESCLCFSLLSLLCLSYGTAENLAENKPAATVSRLTPGVPITRECGPGEKHAFEISLVDPGQRLRMEISKGDFAVSVAVYDSRGQELFEQQSHSYEVVDLSLVTAAPGAYRLEILSLEPGGERRSYELRLEPIVVATLQDRKQTAAAEARARASVLRALWEQRSLRQALANYDDAARIWLLSHNSRDAALSLMRAGEVCLILGDYRESLERYRKAATVAAHGRAKLEEAVALSQVGRLYSYLGDNDQAKVSLRKAMHFLAAKREGNQPDTIRQAYARALNSQGEINYSIGNLYDSGKDFEQALKIFTEVGDRAGAARAHLFKGYIAGGIGEPEKANAEISTALGVYRTLGHKTGEGLSLTGLGLSYSLKRDEENAIKLHREAGGIFRTIGDQKSEGVTLNALGQSFENLSRYPQALDSYTQALGLFQKSGGLEFAAVSLFKIARIHRLTGELPQALAFYEQCLKLSRAAHAGRTEVNALSDVAQIYDLQGSREKTIRQYQRILNFYAAISDRRGQAIALNNLGDYLLRIGERRPALNYYQEALPLSERVGDKGILISTLSNLARAQRDSGALEDAFSNINQAIKIIEALRANVASADFRTSSFAGARKQYDLCIDILMKLNGLHPGQGFDTKAFLTSENARARSLVDILTDAGANIRPGARPERLERERELRGLLRSHGRYQMELAARGKNQTESAEVAREVNQLLAEYEELEVELRDLDSNHLGTVPPEPLSLDQIQAELRDEDTILLEYALGEERSYLWAVTRESLRSYELPSRDTLEKAGHEVYTLLTARQAMAEKIDDGYLARVEASDRIYYQKALSLSQMLLGPVATQLGTKRLLVVSEGMLQYIPFDALPTPRQPSSERAARETPVTNVDDESLVIATHEIVNLPSFATLAAIRREQRRPSSPNRVVAVLADPVFSGTDDRVQSAKPDNVVASATTSQNLDQPALRDFEARLRDGGSLRLAHASEEADAIVEFAPRGAGMVAKGFEASRETAMSSLVGEYKIVHFATHGFLNTEHPELSGIVLTMVNPDGSKTNGLMPLNDIYSLNLSADLVVLSACETALGRDVKGEGLVGLTRGFMSAGSKSVVASLWKVDDRATAMLMAEFYKSMLQDGLSPAAALRSAKQKLMQDKAFSAPYFWAGFVLQGEYTDKIVVDRRSRLRLGLAVSLLLVVISSGLIFLQRRRRRSPPRAPLG